MYEKVLSDKSKYQNEHSHLRSAFSEHRSQLKSLEQQTLYVERELDRATDELIDTALKIPKACPTIGGSSRLKRYLTPIPIAIGMGITSALLTILIWWIVS